MAIVQIIMKIA